MTTIKQAIGAVLIAGGSFGLFVACSTTGNSCVTQSDCGADQVCDASLCTDTCTADSECDSGYTCEAATDATGKVCKKSAVTNTNNSTTNNNTTTAPIGATYNYMMIQDITAGVGCDKKDPGSDLMYILLKDSSGTTLSYAQTVFTEDGTAGTGFANEYTDDGVLSGLAPPLNSDTCDERGVFLNTNVYSLGCGGKISFKFTDSTPPFKVVGGEHTVEVGEFGSHCGGSDHDAYELYGCLDDADVLAGNFGSCTELIDGSAEGVADFVVAR